MIIDVHTHVGLDSGFYQRGWWPYAGTAQELLLHMQANGVDHAACFPFCLPLAFDAEAFIADGRINLLPGRFPFDRENALLVQEVERIDREHRLHPLAMFDPHREPVAQVKNLETLVGKIAGLKTQTTIIQSPIRSLLSHGRPIMEFASAHRYPVVVHTSIAPHDLWAQASDCLDVAEAFPNVRFNLAHSFRFHLSSLKRARHIPNVWIDCSAHLIHCRLARINSPAIAVKAERVDADYSKPTEVLRVIHEILSPGKYLWGSDSPFHSWVDDTINEISTYKQEADALHALPHRVRKDIGETASRAWLFDGKEPTR